MSAKNKPFYKVSRRAARGEGFPRTPVSESVPRQIATQILTTPKYKVSAKIRRKLALRRGVVVEVPRQDPTHPAVKLALKLSKLPLEKLHRRLAQSARRASTCKHLISELSPGSQFAAGILAEQTHQLGMFKQIAAEIKSRTP